MVVAFALAALCALLGSASPAYPMYSDYKGQSYNVTYDKRALKLNGQRAIFLSGALHPPRGSPEMWQGWFDEAKANGLNMVQVYIFWNFHEPLENQYNWAGRGNLTQFVSMAAASGLFVNLRVGPYVCAEWTYGGIPAWLGQKPGVAFRQTNPVWQPAMQKWFTVVVDRMAAAGLFATQGGPIVLVQVENELPGTDEGYVQWCGDMANAALRALDVDVPVTMCNGETANNTINTCNGNDCSNYLEQHGQTGRILIDQPALWTENEGGFQTWGGAPPPGAEPYFWGRPMGDQSLAVLKWFARGGSHMNYYMWTGGSNFGRWTGDGITTMYASATIVCPDGQRNEPAFSFTAAMHRAIAQVSPQLVANDAQLDKGVKIAVEVSAYVYGTVAFVENIGKNSATVSFMGSSYDFPGESSSIIDTAAKKMLFNTKTIPAKPDQARVVEPDQGTALTDWKFWLEPVQSSDVKPGTYPSSSLFTTQLPMEMSDINRALTTFALYETNVTSAALLGAQAVNIDTAIAMAFVVFLDGQRVGDAYDTTHGNGKNISLTVNLDATILAQIAERGSQGTHVLTLLAEELGYSNYGFKTRLYKGVVGQVKLDGKTLPGPWFQRGGLAGEQLQIMTDQGRGKAGWTPVYESSASSAATWYEANFNTSPEALRNKGSKLMLNATGLMRGRFWINGREIGRYFQRPRNDMTYCPPGLKPCATQNYYHVPTDWLREGANRVTLFEASGAADLKTVAFVASTNKPWGDEPLPSVEIIKSCAF